LAPNRRQVHVAVYGQTPPSSWIEMKSGMVVFGHDFVKRLSV
jgi:hypothetical protein